MIPRLITHYPVRVCVSIQESEKALSLQSHLDQESTKKNSILSELSLQSSEIAHLKAKEAQLIKEVHQLRDMKRKFEEDMFKVKNAHMIQLKEAQEQFEAEQYFTQLYKKQSGELREEMEDKLRIIAELEEERVSSGRYYLFTGSECAFEFILTDSQKVTLIK